MSLGNLKDNGSKGSNFSYQKSVLQMLGKMACGDVQSITSASVATGGTIPAGASSVTFTTNGAFTGTVNGVARLASTTYTFKANPGRTLPAIVYTVTAGSVIIDSII